MTVLKYWDQPSGTYKPISGPPGPTGPAGPLYAGGASGQVLTKNSGTDYDYAWTGPMLPLAGGTLTGSLAIDTTVAIGRNLWGRTSGSNRWLVQVGDQATESGSNSGSNFAIYRYTDAGAVIDNPLGILRSSGAVSIKGSATNDSAGTGYVGEYIQAIVASPGVTLTNSVTANVTSISLTAGDWDVTGEVWVAVGTTAAAAVYAGISSTSATLPGGPGAGLSRTGMAATWSASNTNNLSLIPTRVSLATTTTYYLVVFCQFTAGTCTAYGRISARRMR